jgi:hypothetical protein
VVENAQAFSLGKQSFSFPLISFMRHSWSSRIAERYCCVLSPQLADWLDREVWKQTGFGEFHEPVDPASLLESAPEVIWPGLMSCDFLPLIGNASGDWLCVRLRENGDASQIVHWYHGGGDWIPWGEDLAAAIVFDAVVDRLPGPSHRHAIPAELPRLDATRTAEDPFLHWALEHLVDAKSVVDSPLVGYELASELIECQIAEVAIRCELISAALLNTRPAKLSEVFDRLNVSESQFAEYCFDHERIPAEFRSAFDWEQDWGSAEAHAIRVTELAPELAWGWEISGYAAQRRHEIEVVIKAFARGAECSIFTDQSVRLKTHWSADKSMKFSVARLLEIAAEVVQASPYLSQLAVGDADLTRYWVKQGERLEQQQRDAEAHQCFMNAGWDVGAGPMPVYADLLQRVANAAAGSGQLARAELARTHARCLHDRYAV